MKILVAKDAGYCFGVRDAVNLAKESGGEYDSVYMLGDIVHNERVVSDLEKSGAVVVNNLNEIPEDKVEKNEININKTINDFEFNQDNSIEFDEEYRSPGWNRFKKNKALKWKK